MKNKILTVVSTVMLLIPWTILPLRTFDWALESPVAEIMIACYAAFMIFSGVFALFPVYDRHAALADFAGGKISDRDIRKRI